MGKGSERDFRRSVRGCQDTKPYAMLGVRSGFNLQPSSSRWHCGAVLKQSKQSRWLIIALCAAIFALGQFHRAAGSVFTPILMDQFSISATVVSGLVSAMFLAAVLTQLPLGAALDRYGPRRMLCLSVSVVALGTGLFSIGSSYEMLLAGRIIVGFGTAALGASIHVIVAWTFPRREFGYVNGMIIALGSSGGILGTYPLAVALERYDWVWVFGSAAIVALILVLVIFKTVPRPQQLVTEGAQQQTGGYRDLLRSPEVRRILVLGLVTYAPMTTITGIWGGPFLQDVLGFSAEASGAVLLTLYGGSVLAAFCFGHLDRWIAQRKAMILTAVCISTVCLALLAALPSPGSVITIALLFIVIFCQTFYIPLGAHMRKVVSVETVGRASMLLALVSVAAIPAMQTGFGAILDLTRVAGFEVEDQFRVSFGVMGFVMAVCAAVYASVTAADDPSGR